MPAASREILEQLLDAALPKVEIRDEMFGETAMPVDEYKAILAVNLEGFRQDHTFTAFRFRPVVSDVDIQDKLRSAVEDCFEAHMHDGEVLVTRPRGLRYEFHRVSVDRLVSKVVEIALLRGSRHAADVCFESMTTTTCSLRQFAILGGVRIQSEVKLFDGIRLLPIPDDGAERMQYLPAGIDDWRTDLLGFHAVLLIVDHAMTPRFHDGWGSSDCNDHWGVTCEAQARLLKRTRMSQRGGDVGEFDLADFCRVFSIVCDSRVVPICEWHTYPSDEIVNVRGADAVTYGDVTGVVSRPTLDDRHLEDMRSIYRSFVALPPNARKSLRIALDRWREACKLKDEVDRVIDLSIALENIYLAEIDQGEFRFKFALRAAWHLGDTVDERKRLFSQFRDLYDIRSKAVHTGNS